MTALAAGLALVPIALSAGGPGSRIQEAFAAELRGVFISHTHCGASRVEVLVQHQLAGFDDSFFANGSPRVAAAKSVWLDVFKIGQPQGPARS